MASADGRHFKTRARLIAIGLALALIAVGIRAYQLQIVRHTELARLSQDEYLNAVTVPARRGHIYDRRGKPLAISVAVPSVFANPSAINDPRLAARSLAKVLSLDFNSVYQKLASDKLFVWLKRQVDPDTATKVKSLGIAGVNITSESRRFYPNRELASQLVGFVGLDGHGLEGIEKQYDAQLAGEPQVVQAVRDARGNSVLVGDLDPQQRASGADVKLTIDLRLQHVAQKALARAMEETRAKSAQAVVLDVPSSEVLALATMPDFNPNQVATSTASVRRNRVVTDMFEPGSTLKPMVIAAALEAGVVTADTQIFCENGSMAVGNHTIGDTKPHGWLDLTGILSRSSNIGVSKVGHLLGPQKLAGFLRDFNFGARTGIAFPGETAGSLQSNSSWSRLTTATIAFGQGVAVTALQLAGAYRTLANRGVYNPPLLLKSIEYVDGRSEELTGPEGRAVIKPANADLVLKMLAAAASQEGTGLQASVSGFRVGGKTGTAQKADLVAGGYSADRYIALFAGVIPVDKPRVVIVVLVDEPSKVHTGGAVAAPIFAEIGAAAMRFLGVVPSATMLAEAPTQKASAALSDDELRPLGSTVPGTPNYLDVNLVPSFLGLTARSALARYASVGQGLELELSGSGRVTSQTPPPGSQRNASGKLSLVLAE